MSFGEDYPRLLELEDHFSHAPRQQREDAGLYGWVRPAVFDD